ncbi:hypothetical protein AK830_g7307 [Neonectria ditissima]|uniref:Uncharacterized protein n=1 Tax=Neonectria ditissima TaxID=78410 RepID=A0A0P7BF86_9HYPO|nr:hypothetical protein AK830_g7307 [Neonectria ditissima]
MPVESFEAQPSFDGLVAAMQGRDTLSDWDVLVSYDSVQLNNLLSNRARELDLHAPFEIRGDDTDPITHKKRVLVYNLTLLKPTLKFVDTSNITVTCGLTGTVHLDGSSDVGDLPEGLICTISTSLVNVAGEWHSEDGWKPKTADEDKDHRREDGYVTVLEPDSNVTRGVCVDFTNCSVVLRSTDPDEDVTRYAASLNARLTSHFDRVGGLRYCLAAVNNHFNPDSQQGQVLQPTHFCFTIAPGVLMTWIGLKGGPGNGSRQSGKTSLAFAPNSSVMSPVPEGRTASIIFSHATMMNLFLKPSLAASTDVDAAYGINSLATNSNVGMALDFYLTSKEVRVPAIRDHNPSYSRDMDGCTVNLNEKRMRLDISGRRPTAASDKPVGLSWAGNEQTLSWAETYDIVDPETRQHMWFGSHGTVKLNFAYGSSGQWQASSDPVNHPNQLSIGLSFDTSLKVTPAAEEASFWDKIWGKRDSVPSEYRDLRPRAPAIDVHLKPLDYFLTTNLLLPGQHIFHADDPVPASADVQAGLATPRDTILTGNIAGSQALHNKRMAAMAKHRNMISMKESPATATATLDDFKDAMLAFPDNDLLGKYLIMVDKAQSPVTEDNYPAFDTLLRDNGFGNLVGADLLRIWGTSWAEVFKTDDLEPQPSAPEPPKVLDLRIFAGFYTVTQPARDRGSQFMVHPAMECIRMARKNQTPQQVYDPASKKVTMRWESGEKRYAARFELVWDAERERLGARCIGTVKNAEDAVPEPFEAFFRQYLPAADEQNGIHVQDGAGNDPVATGESVITIIAVGVSLIITAATIIGSVIKVGSIRKQLTKELTYAKNAYENLTDLVMEKVGSQTKDLYKNHKELVEDGLDTIDRKVERALKELLQEKTAADSKYLDTLNTDETRDAAIKELGDLAAKKLAEISPLEIARIVTPLAHDTLSKITLDKAMSPERRGDVLKLVVNSAAKVYIDKLLDPAAPVAYGKASAEEVLSRAEARHLDTKMMEQAKKVNGAAEDLADIEKKATLKNKEIDKKWSDWEKEKNGTTAKNLLEKELKDRREELANILKEKTAKELERQGLDKEFDRIRTTKDKKSADAKLAEEARRKKHEHIYP